MNTPTITRYSNFSFRKLHNWHFAKRGLKKAEESAAPEARVFNCKYFSKRRKFTSPIGPMATSFEEVKAAAKKAGYNKVKMGKVEVVI